MELIYSTSMSGRGEDKLCWRPVKCRGFEVGGCYRLLSMSHLMLFPWKIIWGSKVPPRVVFFSWAAALGKILPTDNSRKIGIIVVDLFP